MKKYIRTKDGCITEGNFEIGKTIATLYGDESITEENTADTIEELCDCYSYETETAKDYLVARSWKLHNLERKIYGCILTDKGLIYVAKMNDKGELELI